MEKFSDFMNRTIGPIANKLSVNKYFKALRDGMAPTIPIIVFGSIVMLIAWLPFLEDMIGVENSDIFRSFIGQSYSVTMNMTALIVAFTIAYYFSKREKIEPLSGGLTGLFSFFLVVPLSIDANGSKLLSLDVTGSTGLFLGMVCGLASGKLYSVFVHKGWTIKMPEAVPSAVSNSFASMIPMILTFVIFSCVRMGFMMTSYGDAMNFVFKILQAPMMHFGGTIYSCLLAAGLNQFIWFFGIHPGGIIGSVYSPVLMALSQENFAMIESGREAVNIINQQFYTVFFEGAAVGSGLIALLLILVCKRKENREIGKLGLPAGIFNIGEPIGFGLPIVLNPYMFIPSVFTPLIMLIIGYAATVMKIIPICVNNVPWTTPVILNGFLSTGSIMTSLVQIIGLLICAVAWIPFMKAMEKNQDKLEKQYEETLLQEQKHGENA